jgi:hypothetical protein
MSLLVVGSLALDTIETPFGKAERKVGGSAIFISVAASYFIQPVRLVGVVGGDFPKSELNFLEEREIDLEGLQIIEDGKTFHWHGKYNYDLNTRDSITTELNVFAGFDPVIPEQFKKSQYICLGNINPELQKKDYFHKIPNIIADTMNFWIEGKKKPCATFSIYKCILFLMILKLASFQRFNLLKLRRFRTWGQDCYN